MTNTIAPPTLEELNERIARIEFLKASWRGEREITGFDIELYCLYAVRDGVEVKRQAELEDAHNACIELAAKHGYATGHGDTAGDIIREFNAQIPDHSQSTWMDIETAPKDGTRFLAFELREDYQQYECWWQDDFSNWSGWQTAWDDAPTPTNWMPLSDPPTHNSPLDAKASHNHGEGDPSVMPKEKSNFENSANQFQKW